jgi:hypothetical protein
MRKHSKLSTAFAKIGAMASPQLGGAALAAGFIEGARLMTNIGHPGQMITGFALMGAAPIAYAGFKKLGKYLSKCAAEHVHVHHQAEPGLGAA